MELANRVMVEPLMSNLSRGLWGYHGETPLGRELTVQSTGIGAPSATIVAHELAGLGVRTAVRVGTCVGSRRPATARHGAGLGRDRGHPQRSAPRRDPEPRADERPELPAPPLIARGCGPMAVAEWSATTTAIRRRRGPRGPEAGADDRRSLHGGPCSSRRRARDRGRIGAGRRPRTTAASGCPTSALEPRCSTSARAPPKRCSASARLSRRSRPAATDRGDRAGAAGELLAQAGDV